LDFRRSIAPAVLGHEELYQVPWSSPIRTARRSVEYRFELPEAVFPTFLGLSPRGYDVLNQFKYRGVHVVNAGSYAGRDKAIMAEEWAGAGVSSPVSITRLTNHHDLRAGAELLGYPLVLKRPLSAVSRHVASIDGVPALHQTAERFSGWNVASYWRDPSSGVGG
jgi:glutathione synthase/RimK-type ligase-like ATP-grasp enzyme